MFAGFPQRIFYLVTGRQRKQGEVVLGENTAVGLDLGAQQSTCQLHHLTAELANNASFIVSFSRGETGSILNEMKGEGNAAA